MQLFPVKHVYGGWRGKFALNCKSVRILKSLHLVDKEQETWEGAEGRGVRQEGHYKKGPSSSLKLMQILQLRRGGEGTWRKLPRM